MYPVIEWLRYQAGEEDEYGKPTEGFHDPVPLDAGFAPQATTEPREGTTVRVEGDAQLVLKTPIDYDARDRFRVDGVVYQAEGVAAPWYGMFSRCLFGQVINLRRLNG